MISPLRPRALALCALVLFVAAPLSAQTVDPQSLVGEWTGDWATRGDRQFTGQISMSIARVAGGKVYLETSWWGARTIPPTKLVGNVTADGFTIPGPQFLTTYTLSGDRLRGVTGPGGTTSVSLTRKK